ncbi:hypothetical protein BaRGS_00004161, partial [Batillaria attramentaria]
MEEAKRRRTRALHSRVSPVVQTVRSLKFAPPPPPDPPSAMFATSDLPMTRFRPFVGKLKPCPDGCLVLELGSRLGKPLKTTFCFCLDYVPCHPRGCENDKADGAHLHSGGSRGSLKWLRKLGAKCPKGVWRGLAKDWPLQLVSCRISLQPGYSQRQFASRGPLETVMFRQDPNQAIACQAGTVGSAFPGHNGLITTVHESPSMDALRALQSSALRAATTIRGRDKGPQLEASGTTHARRSRRAEGAIRADKDLAVEG